MRYKERSEGLSDAVKVRVAQHSSKDLPHHISAALRGGKNLVRQDNTRSKMVCEDVEMGLREEWEFVLRMEKGLFAHSDGRNEGREDVGIKVGGNVVKLE